MTRRTLAIVVAASVAVSLLWLASIVIGVTWTRQLVSAEAEAAVQDDWWDMKQSCIALHQLYLNLCETARATEGVSIHDVLRQARSSEAARDVYRYADTVYVCPEIDVFRSYGAGSSRSVALCAQRRPGGAFSGDLLFAVSFDRVEFGIMLSRDPDYIKWSLDGGGVEGAGVD